MKQAVVETMPARGNWERFCQEPELTKEEWGTWYELAVVARANENVAHFIETEAAAEIAESEQSIEYTKDWSDMVQWSDRFKRMRRAQIAAWRKWQQEGQ